MACPCQAQALGQDPTPPVPEYPPLANEPEAETDAETNAPASPPLPEPDPGADYPEVWQPGAGELTAGVVPEQALIPAPPESVPPSEHLAVHYLAGLGVGVLLVGLARKVLT